MAKNDKKELSPKIVNSFKKAKKEVAQTKLKVEAIEKELQAQKIALEKAKLALENAEKNINQANLDMLGEFARVSGISVMEIMIAFAGKDFFAIQEKVEKNGCSKEIFNDFLALINEEVKEEISETREENNETNEEDAETENSFDDEFETEEDENTGDKFDI